MMGQGAGARATAGKCLFGAARYAAKDEFLYPAYCRCSNCRRATGAAFKPCDGIERDKLILGGGREEPSHPS
jgi:hypothetical protein